MPALDRIREDHGDEIVEWISQTMGETIEPLLGALADDPAFVAAKSEAERLRRREMYALFDGEVDRVQAAIGKGEPVLRRPQGRDFTEDGLRAVHEALKTDGLCPCGSGRPARGCVAAVRCGLADLL